MERTEDMTMAKTSASNMRAIERYRIANYRSYTIKLSRKYEQDLIEYLDTIENKQGYLKELIRKDMEAGR